MPRRKRPLMLEAEAPAGGPLPASSALGVKEASGDNGAVSRSVLLHYETAARVLDVPVSAIHRIRTSRKGLAVFEPSKILGGVHYLDFPALVRLGVCVRFREMLSHSDMKRMWEWWGEDQTASALSAAERPANAVFLRHYPGAGEPEFVWESERPGRDEPHLAVNVTALSTTLLERVVALANEKSS